MKKHLKKSKSNKKEIKSIDSTLNKLAECVRCCSTINHVPLGKYIKSLSVANKIFKANKISGDDMNKIKEQLPRVIEAAENTITRIMV